MEKQKLYEQHSENAEWINKLNFYQDELAIMQKRVSEIAAKNSSKEVLSLVEHFQNQLIIQDKNIDDIKTSIHVNENVLVNNVNQNPVAVDHRSVPDHSKERELMGAFEQNFNNLRHELNAFTAKWI